MNILRHPAVIIVLILLVVLLFGSRRLPDMARSVGQSLKIFKKEVKELKDDGTEGGEAAAGQADDGVAGTSTSTTSSTSPSTEPAATPPPTSPPSTTAAAPNGTSQQVPGLTDPQQPRA